MWTVFPDHPDYDEWLEANKILENPTAYDGHDRDANWARTRLDEFWKELQEKENK